MAGLDQLSSRERNLVVGFGVVFGLLLVILVPLRVSAYLGDRQRYNDDLRQAILDVNSARTKIAARKAALGDVAARYANKAPPLGTVVDTAAKAASLEITSQSDAQPMPRGKLYTERTSKLTVQKTGLRALANFMEKIETSGHPVAITQLDMTKRIEPDSYTVNMTISAYDRVEPAAAPVSSGGSGGGK